MTFILLDEINPGQVISRQPQGVATQEHPLRDLLFEHPELLPVKELEPEIGNVIAVTRELSLPGAGFVDVFLVSEHGRLILVECKLWRNPQARREVVGQILDYARELARYSYDDLQRAVSSRLKRPGNALYELARSAGSTLSEADFVDRVARDLRHGRFLLLIAGDGITEGTQRIGEYLQAQAGLAFDFGLIEMAEYRFLDPATGTERRIMQPRLLAKTAVIERHVIRQEVPGIVIEPIEDIAAPAATTPSYAASDSFAAWRSFVDRFLAEVRFDDPGQLPPRSGGNGWIRLPLPDGLYVNLYRSASEQKIGAQVRFAGSEGAARWSELLVERTTIDGEFLERTGETLDWIDGDVPLLRIIHPSPLPWDDAATEEAQRRWFAAMANQFVNSLRPRLLGNDAA